jgi:hypothetical protein
VKLEMEYSDYSESEEESCFMEEKDRSLIKRKDREEKMMMEMEKKSYNNSKIKNSFVNIF